MKFGEERLPLGSQTPSQNIVSAIHQKEIGFGFADGTLSQHQWHLDEPLSLGLEATQMAKVPADQHDPQTSKRSSLFLGSAAATHIQDRYQSQEHTPCGDIMIGKSRLGMTGLKMLPKQSFKGLAR